jgi:type I restriction enzyme S subunit
MIGGLKPYPAMKHSGVPWLGEVPEHWEVLPTRALFSEVRDRKCVDEQLLSVTISQGVISQASLLTNSSKKDSSNEDKANYKLVRPGDIAYNKMRAWQGAVGVSQYQGIVSPAYVVMRPRGKQNANYFHYLLRTPAFATEAERWSYGITSDQWSLRPEHFKMIYCSLPPEGEQATIIQFLDHADLRIRRYIRAKQKLIKLLKEQKQAIIHRAVTRGLDPSVRLKPSGMGWLGDVPEHWALSRLKFEVSHIVDCLHATPQYSDDGEYPAIRTADIEPGKLRLERARRVNREQYGMWTARLAPRAGDILYSREGERFGIAACVPDGVRLCISQRMMVLRIRPPHRSDYIMWQLNCPHVYAQAAADVIGATSPHVNVERIKNYWIAIPPPAEQERIVETVIEECRDIEAVVGRAHREILLLREYRTRLIADVTTGKLDVRAAAASLPDETSGSEVFDTIDALTEDEETGEDIGAKAEEVEA